jgi:hypothetical protein
MELRRRRSTIAGEAFFASLIMGIPGGILFVSLRNSFDEPAPWLFGFWVGFALLANILFAIFRWRSRLEIDAEGISYFRSGDEPRVQINWSEVTATFRTGQAAILVRGPAGSIRVTGIYRNYAEACQMIRERTWQSIGESLRREYYERQAVIFSAPWPGIRAHAAYLAILQDLAPTRIRSRGSRLHTAFFLVQGDPS